MEKLNLGCQLYSLREYCATPKLFHPTVDKVAEIGYKYIQYSGDNSTFEDRVEALKRTGLKCTLTHWDDKEIVENTDEVIEKHNILGCDGIGIGGLPGDMRNMEGYKLFIDKYGKAIEKIGRAGKCFCYHNHWFEFERYSNGKTGMEMLLENSDPDGFKLTLDTAWAHRAGIDCADFIRRYHDRIYALHLKDYTIKDGEITLTEMLTGNMNFDSIISECCKYGIKNLFVEQDFIYINAFESMKISRDNLLNKFGEILQ